MSIKDMRAETERLSAEASLLLARDHAAWASRLAAERSAGDPVCFGSRFDAFLLRATPFMAALLAVLIVFAVMIDS